MNVLLDIDSDERNPVFHPNTNDYVVKLNRPLYNVKNIRLVGAQIPLTQTLINDYNNTFSVDGQTITLENKNYTNGTDLASDIQMKLNASSNVSFVSFDSTKEVLSFSNVGTSNLFTFEFYNGKNGFITNTEYGTPASIFGFNHNNQSNISGSNVITGGTVDLNGPTSIILRITTNDSDLSRDVFNSGKIFKDPVSNIEYGSLDYTESVYFGRLLTEKYDVNSKFLIFAEDYPLEERFHRGSEKSIRELRIRFYYSIGTKLLPYDFGNRNHTLKFEINCSLDKLKTLETNKPIKNELPPPVNIPKLQYKERHDNKKQFVIIFIALMSGLFFLLMFKQ